MMLSVFSFLSAAMCRHICLQTDYLISSYGSAKYYEFYSCKDCTQAIKKVYNKSPEELSSEFMTYVKLLYIDNELKNRMAELIEM